MKGRGGEEWRGKWGREGNLFISKEKESKCCVD
jgi:hypothetical protein